MKTKILLLAAAVFAATILAGCGNNSSTMANPPANQQMPDAGGNPAVITNLSNTNLPAATNQ